MKKSIALIMLAFVTISFGCTKTSIEVDEVKIGLTNTKVSGTEKNKTLHLTNESFKQKVFNYEVNKDWKYEGDLPCIIDFYADWCRPCKMMAPILEELAEEYSGKILIYKVNTEKERELSAAFGIRSIPSLLFVPANGQPQMTQGVLSKESLKQVIEEVLLQQMTK